jgi:hypothetical protein
MPSNSLQLISPINSRLARQLIASAPDAARQLNDELCGQAWTEQDVSWLQDELAKRLGYLIVDWSRPSRREGERIAVNIHRQTCIERKWPLVVVYIGLHYCTVQIDTDPIQRPKEKRQGSPRGDDNAN